MRKNAKQTFRRRLTPRSAWRKPWIYLALLLVGFLVLVALYQIPSIHDRAYFHLATARAKIYYFFKPPAAEVFQPTQQGTLDASVFATLTAMAPTATITPQPTYTPTFEPTAQNTSTSTITPTVTLTPTPLPPLPPSALIEGIEPEIQGFNNCGPTNLAMALRFWGWKGNQKTTEAVLKPFIKDRNVMPYEMLGYVQEQTELNGIVRYGGDLDLVKRLVSSGFPVLIERGYIDRHEGWMGHYGLIVGYDDRLQEVTIPDTYLGLIKMSYTDITRYWEAFDRIYLVIFPYERQQEVYDILGAQMDAQYNKEYTLDLINSQLYEREGLDQFFIWYSRGSICVELNDYLCAGESYDKAFSIYATLKEEERPWRMLWYQTGPYYAYYYLQRYQDLYTLTKQTLDKTPEDAIPETWVWKGRAEVKLGLRDQAIDSFKQALFWHPHWWVAEDELIALGEKVD